MDKIKVLLVEDESTLAMIVQDTLNAENFDVTVASDGIEGLTMMGTVRPDIVVADIMMPQMDGFEMVRRMRQTDTDTPVLFLTARSAVADVVEGFELGGNDYLRKPFSMLELMVRIRALIKRNPNRINAADKGDNNTITFGLYSLNPTTQVLWNGVRGEQLSHRESEVLRMLASQTNQVVESRDILLALWGDDNLYNARSLHVFITKLRHKLEDDPSVSILNVRSIGYKMVINAN